MKKAKALALAVLVVAAASAVLFYESQRIHVGLTSISFREGPGGEELMDVDVVVDNRGVISGDVNLTGSLLYVDGRLAATLYRPVLIHLEPGGSTSLTVTYRVVDEEPLRRLLDRGSGELNVTLDARFLVAGMWVDLPEQTRTGRITLGG